LYNQSPLSSDVRLGTQSGAGITTGANNTIVGHDVADQLTTGSANTIIGNNSSPTLVSGNANTVIGANITGPSASGSNVVILADGAGQSRFDYGQTTASVATVSAKLAVNPSAVAAGTSANPVVLFSTTAGFGIYFGSGAPSFAAGVGSLYLRSDGSSTSTRLYVCSVAT